MQLIRVILSSRHFTYYICLKKNKYYIIRRRESIRYRGVRLTRYHVSRGGVFSATVYSRVQCGPAKTVCSDLQSVCGRRGPYSSTGGSSGSPSSLGMTFRTKSHGKQSPQQQQQHDTRHQTYRGDGQSQYRNRHDKTAAGQFPPPAAIVVGGPAAIAVAAAPAAVAHPDADGAPCIYTTYGPRCYVIQKVSEPELRRIRYTCLKNWSENERASVFFM